jgi:hypothetical protein
MAVSPSYARSFLADELGGVAFGGLAGFGEVDGGAVAAMGAGAEIFARGMATAGRVGRRLDFAVLLWIFFAAIKSGIKREKSGAGKTISSNYLRLSRARVM